MNQELKTQPFHKLIIHAVNIHQGGGRTLLLALLEERVVDVEIIALLDERMALQENLPKSIKLIFFKPSIWQRLKAERWLAKNINSNETVLCFGNLPPIFKLRGRVLAFIQNRYLVDNIQLTGFPIKVKLRIIIERIWLRLRVSNVDKFIVQTPSMKNVTCLTGLIDKEKVDIIPFRKNYSTYYEEKSSDNDQQKKYDFIYVASGEPHKNHRGLIDAWCLLANEGIRPSICLTLDKQSFRHLCEWISEKQKKYELKIFNVGSISHEGVLDLYKISRALIFPSHLESFGLPLIEAQNIKLPVLAPELDYVRDVVSPEQTFNPDSPISIARAVKRHLKIEQERVELLDAANFTRRLLENDP